MEVKLISGTSPATAAQTVVVGSKLTGLSRWRGFRIDARLVGATGGTLNVYLQRKIAPDKWTDWCSFTQLAAGAAAIDYALTADHANSTTIVTTTNGGTDSTPVVALAAGTFVGGHPGDEVRMVCVSGASTSAGAALNVYFTTIGVT